MTGPGEGLKPLREQKNRGKCIPQGRAKNAATKSSSGNGANPGFEVQLFLAADKLRKNLAPSDYKHVVLGLIFLKYISDAFEDKHAEFLAENGAAAEDQDEYRAENIFWVPKTVKKAGASGMRRADFLWASPNLCYDLWSLSGALASLG